MIELLRSTVDGGNFITFLIMILLLGYFVYKEWPEFRKRVSTRPIQDKSMEERIASIEVDIKDVKEKMDRDYRRINEIEKEMARNRRNQARDREEMEIIMKGVLAALQGLQQQGCNGVVSDTEKEINEYLNKIAHETWEE